MGDSPQQTTRRRLLQTLGVGLAGGLAGCPASVGDDSTPTTDPPATATQTQTETQTPPQTATSTQTATPTPPAIEQRLLQRESAAVTHVVATVAATVSFPRFNTISPLSQGVVGTWHNRNSDETLTLTRTREFDSKGTATPASGTYTIRPVSIRLDFDGGGTATFEYTVDTDESPAALRLFQQGDPFAVYTRAAGPGALDPVALAQTFEFYRLTGTPAGTVRREVQTGTTGSGFLVSPAGHIVTSASAVLADQEPTRMSLQRLANRTASHLQQSVRQHVAGIVTDAELVTIQAVFSAKLSDYFDNHASIAAMTQTTGAVAGTVGPDDDVQGHTWPATVETAGSVVTETADGYSWGEDVALVSVDQTTLPTVTLGSADDISTGEEIFVIGYPRVNRSELFGERTTALEPTLASGVVTARRTLDSGINTIQTDAAIDSGTSGGPIYNSDGEVVGIATFAPTSAATEQAKFGLPIDLAEEYMQQVGVENRSGDLDTAFDTGLEAYWRGDCETATTKMQTVLDIYPAHPSAQRYIDNCERGDAPGQ